MVQAELVHPSAGLVCTPETGATTAEQRGRLMPSGERAELERAIRQLLAENPSTLSLGGKVLVDMTAEELRSKLTELRVAVDDDDDDATIC